MDQPSLRSFGTAGTERGNRAVFTQREVRRGDGMGVGQDEGWELRVWFGVHALACPHRLSPIAPDTLKRGPAFAQKLRHGRHRTGQSSRLHATRSATGRWDGRGAGRWLRVEGMVWCPRFSVSPPPVSDCAGHAEAWTSLRSEASARQAPNGAIEPSSRNAKCAGGIKCGWEKSEVSCPESTVEGCVSDFGLLTVDCGLWTLAAGGGGGDL